MDLIRDFRDQFKPIYDIKRCAFNSYNWYHDGVDELIYEVGLKWELENLHYAVHRQEEFNVFYKGHQTEIKRRLDLVVETASLGNIILELKALNYIEDKQRKQLWSYMRLLNNDYGMIINFGPQGVYSEIWKYDKVFNTCKKINISL